MRLTLSLIFAAACASPGQARSEDPTSSPAEPRESARVLVDAADANADADAGFGYVTKLVSWTDASTCSFPPVSPAEGKTAKQCCTPVSALEVCLETMSTIHHHEVGWYTKRTLTLVRRPQGEGIFTLPLDRHHHRSMKYADTASLLLAFRVHQRGLDVSLRYGAGCKASCVAAHTCTGEARRVASLCESVGAYAWDGQQLLRVPPRVE
jgi:hypothetical protein